MSTRIRVSYEQEPELLDVVVLLGKRVIKVEREPAKGRYKRAYLTIAESTAKPEQLAKQG